MSLHVLGAPLAGLVGAVPAADGAGYQSPTTQEFYQPLIGDGPFAVTRASIVILLSVAMIGWFLVATTRRAAIVPSKGQWVTESVAGQGEGVLVVVPELLDGVQHRGAPLIHAAARSRLINR